MVALMMIGSSTSQMDDLDLTVLSRKARYALFPDSSTMGLYLAVAVPLEDASYDVSVSWNFEATYQLPSNYTELILPFVLASASRSERQFNRRSAYRIVEKRFKSYGLKGRECLLRTICEAAESPLLHNGLFGDILHIIFTPSSSADENLHPVYSAAEERGRSGKDCRSSYPRCPVGLLDTIAPFED
ncbi:uncharacterized protein LOC110837208 isoform X2 [Zootermopsis nevadensis]|nr:uncharacterized protein LOC110837208 isoform X2 [Zootermopsis nevadensis]XP_021934804.1 uncharacterized protein LOC110837208 isoform X2 [Zootermopsis nevadensis]